MIYWHPSQHGPSENTHQTTATRSGRVVKNFSNGPWESLNNSQRLFVLSSGFCSNIQPTFYQRCQYSNCTIRCCLVESVPAEECISLPAFSKSTSSCFIMVLSSLACVLQSRFDSGNAILTKLDTNSLNTLRSPRKDLNTVTVVGTCNFTMVSALRFST